MSDLLNINISEYNYDLPDDKISQYPLDDRDKSKLLIYRNGEISEDIFRNVYQHIPIDSLLVFNDTRVIQARLNFSKQSGARIEIFCLEPVLPVTEIHSAFIRKSPVVWNCLVGNSKKWKKDILISEFTRDGIKYILSAERFPGVGSPSKVKFEWEPHELSFAEILDAYGIVPLPPYINRKPEKSDSERYQTIYAKINGSVAAPTAGLHFTENVLNNLKSKNISSQQLTLHVGAGTFTPVSSENISKHVMHTELISVKKSLLEDILNLSGRSLVAVGTTTVRTLESIYWYGVMLKHANLSQTDFKIEQWDPYQINNTNIDMEESLSTVLEYMNLNKLDEISGSTSLIIVPGYECKIADILVTNFHMPRSTLLLLVSAFIGDAWKNAYDFALKNNYRFLSYGDSCLFFKKKV